jgi:hypothetical protein
MNTNTMPDAWDDFFEAAVPVGRDAEFFGKTLHFNPVDLDTLFVIVPRFPEVETLLFDTLKGKKLPDSKVLFNMATTRWRAAVCALIAASLGKLEDLAFQERLMAVPSATLLSMLKIVLELSMPAEFKDFLSRFQTEAAEPVATETPAAA